MFWRGFTYVFNMASLYQCSSCLFASPTMEDLVNHICLNPPFNGNEAFCFVFFFSNQGYSRDLRTWNIRVYRSAPAIQKFVSLSLFVFLELEEISFVGEDICAAALQQAGASTSTAQSPKFLERWEDNHVRLLISSFSKFKDLFG